jgi:7-cyano-7-deazaguanine synthase
MQHNEECLVILSGGQDSTTCLFMAKQMFEKVHAVTFDYGQKHRLEIESAIKVAEMAQIESHEVIRVPGILQGRSPLVDPSVELERYQNFNQMDTTIGDRVELTFVPMRNALFMVLAANRAICKDIRNLVTGVCQADNANYPDCRRSFVDVQETTISLALGLDKTGMGPMFRILTPLMYMSKAESVREALQTPGAYKALAWSHTSYDGQFPPTDMNHANVLRAHGFEEAGVPDPLVLRAWWGGLMELPVTANYDKIRQLHWPDDFDHLINVVLEQCGGVR